MLGVAIFCGLYYAFAGWRPLYLTHSIWLFPLTSALPIGLLMGDVKGAMILGAAISMLYVGLIAPGAEISADGCAAGIKTLSRFLNRYSAADERSKSLVRRLIGAEEKLAADIIADRAKQAGLHLYDWYSLMDGRERSYHAYLHGKRQDTRNANHGDKGMFPRQPIRCRCWARWIIGGRGSKLY